MPPLLSQNEAGQLLLNADAYGEFTLIIGKEALENLKDDTPYLSFSNISLARSVDAGW